MLRSRAPTITSNGAGSSAAVSVAENTSAVTTVAATDPDAGQTVSYAIFGGADAASFTINSTTGQLAFASAPDFETPTDDGGNNVYDVIVQASDGNGGADTQAIAVTVTQHGVALSSVPLSETINAGRPCTEQSRSSSRTTRTPERDVSSTLARHSRVKSSTLDHRRLGARRSRRSE